MALHYKSGGYVGGCGAQVGGLILVIVLLAIYSIIPDSWGDVIWSIFKSIPLIIVGIVVFLYLFGMYIEYRDKKNENEEI